MSQQRAETPQVTVSTPCSRACPQPSLNDTAEVKAQKGAIEENPTEQNFSSEKEAEGLCEENRLSLVLWPT